MMSHEKTDAAMSDTIKGDILIVDDRPENLKLLSSMLKKEGYRVRVALNGQAGLASIRAKLPDLILLDVIMPGLSGFDVCRSIKADGRTHHIPVIFISATDETTDKVKGFKLGGIDYITKPFREEEVLIRLHNYLKLTRLQMNFQNLVSEQTRELISTNEKLRQEIAVRHQTERRLRRLSVAIECAAEDIIITDKDGVIEYVNPAFERVTGYDMDSVIGQTPRILKSGRHDKNFYNILWKTLLNKKIWKGHIINRKKDGTIFEQEASIAPILDADGNISGFVSVKRDKTEEEQLKSQLIHAQKMEAIGTLSGGIAHDFNNILGGIIGYMELGVEALEEQNPNKTRLKKYMERTLEAGNRAKSLVNQILQFSRRDQSDMQPLKMKPLVKETIKLLRAILPKTIEVSIMPCADDDTVIADPGRIQQVLMNICTNAFHAMRRTGGKLTVRLDNVILEDIKRFHTMAIPPGNYLKIEISDTGHGIPSEITHRIFEPYVTTKKMNEGTGLGLSVSLGIIENHNGLIEFESIPGNGTAFFIFLPIDRSMEKCAHDPAESFIPIGKGENVLLIDDELFFLEAVREHIEMLGYRVTAIQDAPKALEIFKADMKCFDLIMTDQTMPVITGIQMISEIRKLNACIPIILCSGYSEAITEQIVDRYAISKVLLKPVHRKDLANAVHEALKSSQTTGTPQRPVGTS